MIPRKQTSSLGRHRCQSLFFVAISVQFWLAATASDNSTFVPRDVLLLNCGSGDRAMDTEKREWRGDVGSAFLPILSAKNSTVAAPAGSDRLLSIPAVPFLTARIISGPATYSIPVEAERIFVRLYFYPTAYNISRPISDVAVFDVTTNRHTLLRNFTPGWDAEALNLQYITREYSLNVSNSGFLNLTFTPSTCCPGSYAFVNGIEVISMPPDIFSPRQPLLIVGSKDVPFDLSPSSSLETMYRLNVGGAAVSPGDDSGLFRRWGDDSFHIFGGLRGPTTGADPNITLRYPPATPRYIAPDVVYMTQRSMGGSAAANRQANLTWFFTVDPGFYYLVRLHFCEIHSIFNKPNERVFSIYINNMTADLTMDVFARATLLVGSKQQGSGLGIPFYEDYITVLPDDPEKVDLWLDLHSFELSRPEYADAVLNGLEIFKLNNQSDGSLAGIRPKRLHARVQSGAAVGREPRRHERIKAGVVAGVVAGGFVVVIGLLLFSYWYYRRKQNSRLVATTKPPMWPNLCCRFTFAEIEAATNGFDETLVLGVGGFGKVYKGMIASDKFKMAEGDDGPVKTGEVVEVAIKRANPSSRQGAGEFLNEISKLWKLRHKHLVSLVGFCDEAGEMILVYEYMTNGTLMKHLYNDSGEPTLGWKQRLQICVGVATGLHYLHTGHGIIHRDIKTTNILLDETWIAKVADFGISKLGPAEMEQEPEQEGKTHVTTDVKGTFGYMDPEYYRRMQLTDKSDVYSFGVVLFEVLCGRRALDESLPPSQINLANWVRLCYDKDLLVGIMDKQLRGQISPPCFEKFTKIAHKCIALRRAERPSMGDVLRSLEAALKEQEVAEATGSFEGVGMGTIPMVTIEDSYTTISTISFGFANVKSDGLTPASSYPSPTQAGERHHLSPRY